MSEKRYITNKYVHCYCTKGQDILVGMKPYRLVNILILPPSLVGLCALILIIDASVLVKVVSIVGIALFLALLCKSYYSHAKKEMLKWGHTEECSRKVGRMAVLYAGVWSEFRAMDVEEE